MIYDGFAFLSKDQNVPFHFENGYLELFLGGSHFTFEKNTRVIVGQKRGVMTGDMLLFHLSLPLEYYQRTFLPEISSEVTIKVYDDVRDLVEEYVNAQSGEKKRKAKRLLSSISPTVSLQDKICKVYNGYDSWLGLKTILSKYFGEDVSDLASVANQWRNELAHEKREYEPDRNVISAVRLVEHLNYCIILRFAGYSDDVIKGITEEILTR